MKKLYTSILAILFSSFSFSQVTTYTVDPVYNVMSNKGYFPWSDFGLMGESVYMDSTTRVSYSAGTNTIDAIMLGNVLDLTSTMVGNAGVGGAIATSMDPAVTLDSVFILGAYKRPNNYNDTLYVWVVWGDSANTSVFSKRPTSSAFYSPISGFRTEIVGPQVTGYGSANGNTVHAAAPGINMRLMKRVLTIADTSSETNLNYIKVPLPSAVTIPAGNLISCFYTFVPGGPHALGDVSYAWNSSLDPQTTNGFLGVAWYQYSPSVSAISDYIDMQVDPSGYNMGATYSIDQRYGISTSVNSSLNGNPILAPVIYYKITASSLVSSVSISASGSSSFCPGDSVLLVSSINVNSSVSYQWKLNGINIPGATGSTYTATASGIYTVEISNSSGSLSSNQLTVSTYPLPAVSTIIFPSAAFCVGNSVSLNGTGAQSYSWSSGISDGVYFTPSTLGTFTYTVTGTDGNGCTNTAAASFTVLPLPSITSQPVNTTVASGANASFTVICSSGTATYQWQVNAGTGWNNLSNFGPYSGTNTATLNITGANSSLNNNAYQCIIQDSCSTISSMAILTVSGTVGINEINNQNITIHPNPATSFTTITFAETQKNTAVIVMDVVGNCIQQLTANGKQLNLDMSSYSKGVYFVQITDENKNITNKKIIVE